jgi:antibiotic biosynthesis monooxygenase (ABM) superfamily enzyme
MGGKAERVVDLRIQASGAEGVLGPAAKDYVESTLFEEKNIKLAWFDYKEYPRHRGEFKHNVTILDLLFNCGKGVHLFMKHMSL